MKIALITGITGMDGSHLADFLLAKDYKVVGIKRRTSTNNTSRIAHLLDNENFTLLEGDVSDPVSITNIIVKYKPDEIYHLAAQSHVHTSFEQPAYTFQTNANSILYILEAVRQYSPATKVYFAATSEMFGKNYTLRGTEKVQDLSTAFVPQSPYGIAKLAGYHLTRLYREAYGIFACSGILFNHEGPRRGENFVTRKITKYVANLFCNSKRYYEYGQVKPIIQPPNPNNYQKLKLGNLDAFRDWSYAPDMVHGMWLMLQQPTADDYILCSGETHSVREFVAATFAYIGIENWEDYVEIDPGLYRPAEVDYLRGDASKAHDALNWQPTAQFEDLVGIMVDADIEELEPDDD